MTVDEARQKLDQERAVCAQFIDSAKAFTQLSTGALVLSLALARDFLGDRERELLRDGPMVFTWILWLFAVLFGATYEYCAIKYLEKIANDHNLLYHPRNWRPFVPDSLIENPFWLFGTMLTLFFAGLISFTYVFVVRFFGST